MVSAAAGAAKPIAQSATTRTSFTIVFTRAPRSWPVLRHVDDLMLHLPCRSEPDSDSFLHRGLRQISTRVVPDLVKIRRSALWPPPTHRCSPSSRAGVGTLYRIRPKRRSPSGKSNERANVGKWPILKECAPTLIRAEPRVVRWGFRYGAKFSSSLWPALEPGTDLWREEDLLPPVRTVDRSVAARQSPSWSGILLRVLEFAQSQHNPSLQAKCSAVPG